MDALRTAPERIDHLPGFGWHAHGFEAEATAGLRMVYLDEDPRDAQRVFLCLHGNPSCSYLYRKMIPVFAAAGARVVAPDLLDFGRSDKPVHEVDHSFAFHRDSLISFVEHLDLRRITLVVQDWGGLFGLTLPMHAPERYERLLVMNTALGTGRVTEGFRAGRSFSNSKPDLDVGGSFRRSEPALSAAECAAYDAPFPDAQPAQGHPGLPRAAAHSRRRALRAGARRTHRPRGARTLGLWLRRHAPAAKRVRATRWS